MLGVIAMALGTPWLILTAARNHQAWQVIGVSAFCFGALLRLPWLSTLLYLIIGWVGVIAARQLWGGLSVTQFSWLAGGGLCYTAGVPFYLWKRRPHAHGTWHLFVIGGVACHFIAIRYLITG